MKVLKKCLIWNLQIQPGACEEMRKLSETCPAFRQNAVYVP